MSRFNIGDRVVVIDPPAGAYRGDLNNLFFPGQEGVVVGAQTDRETPIYRIQFDAPTPPNSSHVAWWVPEGVLSFEDSLFSEVSSG